MAAALGATVADSEPPGDIAAEALSAFYRSIGMPTRIRDLGVPASSLAGLVRDTVKNFNANPRDRPADQEQRMLALLEAAW
jgi:alcohol dehydrogenase class IV